MKITQISVFLENTKGRLYDVCALLGSHGVNMRALTIADAPEFGILRMVVDKPAEAVTLLKRHNITAALTDIVAVEVDDRPGGLAAILKELSDRNVNVEYMYGFVEKKSDRALMVFRFTDPDAAIAALQAAKVRVLGKDEAVGL